MTGTDGPSVLVVDDHPEIAHLVRLVLASSGFRAVTAGSAEAAVVAYADARKFDLVVTDVTLADRPGPALVAELGHPIGRTLFISGHARERFEGTSADLPLGAAFLQKPFGPAALLAFLRGML
ncbi:MAG: response regulator [Actinomycetota bacterium]|nr:response regulator [Actinomycetota bacterium]